MSTATPTRDDIVMELQDIQNEILERVNRAKELLKDNGYEGALMRADSYWIPHIVCAVTNDHGYLGGSLITMQDTIEELDNADDDEEADED